MIVFGVFSVILVVGRAVRVDDICGKYDGRRMYLELGEYGILQAKNQTAENFGKTFDKVSPQRQCSIELITCPSCSIKIKFTFLNISRNCGKNSVMESCGCDYVWIYEPSFEEVSGEQFCGHFIDTNSSSLLYSSQTRSTTITFLFSNYHQHAFTLEYTSERNRRYLDGFPKYSNMNNGSQFISSPFFPYYYPRDLNTEYVITCKTKENCRIRLIFTDFQISPNSLIEFFDWNGQRMHVTTGTIFRPPLLISSGPTMVIRFYANGGTNLGFKANYMFLLGQRDNSTLKADTDCGGYVNALGGGITMMDMIKGSTKSYDCFWIIHPPESYLHLKTQLYLKVINFSDFAGSTELVVRQGLTSNEPAIEVLRHPVSQYVMSKQKEHVVPISQGFYISLKGLFTPESRLAIVYSAFNYKDCYSGLDFLCRNLRCIPMYLICDGFDHCGDNSDEITNCVQDSKERLRWAHTPNFFFPKIDRYSYLKTATILFIICSLGLIGLIFALILLLYKINSRNRNQRQLQTHLQTINDMLVCTVILDEGTSGLSEEEIVVPDEPPHYEAPPNYEDSLKVEHKKKSRKRSPRRSTIDKRSCTRCDTVTIRVDGDFTANTSQINPVAQTVPQSPPPSYSLLPKIEISDCNSTMIEEEANHTDEEIVDISVNANKENQVVLSNNIFTLNFPSIDIAKLKYLSLQDIHVTIASSKKFRSMDLFASPGAILSKFRAKRCRHFLGSLPLSRQLCLSDSELLVSPEKSGAFGGANKKSRLMRSVSIENLFTI